VTVADWAGLATAVVTLLGLILIFQQLRALNAQAEIQAKQAKLQADQAKLQTYSDYTKRYEALVARFSRGH
jgi:hypothetical protein